MYQNRAKIRPKRGVQCDRHNFWLALWISMIFFFEVMQLMSPIKCIFQIFMKICIFMKIRAKHLKKVFQILHFFWSSWMRGEGLVGGDVRPRGGSLLPNLKNCKKNFGTIVSGFFGIFDREFGVQKRYFCSQIPVFWRIAPHVCDGFWPYFVPCTGKTL